MSTGRRIAIGQVGRAVLGPGVAGLCVAVLGVATARDTLATQRVRVDLASPLIDAARPLRIAQVTDFHNLPRRWQVDRIVRLVRDADPDLVTVTGDLVQMFSHRFGPARHLITELVALGVPVFFVMGNHDQENKLFDPAWLADLGVHVLTNECEPLDGPWGRLDVVGTDDHYTGHGHLALALQGRRPGVFTLVLAHTPEGIAQELEAMPDHEVDLVLSGHTHGGQVRIPGLWPRALPVHSPEGRRWVRGRYEVNGATLYICQGCGTSGPTPRLGARSQVSLVTVHGVR